MIKPQAPTVSDLLLYFSAALEALDQSPHTVKSYCSDMKHFETWFLSVIPTARVNEVDTFTLQRYRGYLDHTEKRAASTTNRRLQALRRFFAWALAEGIISANPATAVKLKAQPKLLKPRSLASTDIHKVLTLSGRGPQGVRNYALVQLLLQAGLRIGEVEALHLSDIALYERSGVVRIRNGKGGKERSIPLNASARKALSAWLSKHPKQELSNSTLFVASNGKSLKKRALQKIITEIMVSAGCEASAHTLRHTFATRHYQEHGKLVELSTVLGHESLNTTARYTQASHEDLARMMETSSLNEFGE